MEFITQCNAANADVWKQLADLKNHSVLFDASCGQGISTLQWLAPFFGVNCGYAGGLGPLNLEYELPRIQYAAGFKPFWIDMESALRENDVFNLDSANSVLNVAGPFIK